MKSLNLPAAMFNYDPEGDPYGEAMWVGLTEGGYESTTLGFVLTSVKDETLFVDIGAASGLFTLVAASIGAKCLAIEAHPHWFGLLQRNLSLNTFAGNVACLNVAVTGLDLASQNPDGVDSRVLSQSVIDKDSFEKNPIPFVALSKVLEEQVQGHKRLVVKMDIEGAEFGILRDALACQSMQSRNALLFLSLHPGFPYNKRTRTTLGWLWNAAYSRFRGIIDCLTVYRNLRGSVTCRLPNGREIKRKADFLALTFFGAHDYVFDLSKTSRL